MKTNDTLTFDLSLDELHWLAGAFGIVSLPLPDHAQEDNSRAQLIERQKKGHASLLRRGLVQPSPGFGWQVDRLPAAIVQWMASADSMLRVERIERENGKRVMNVFTSNDQALSVEIMEGNARFLLYKTRVVLRKTLFGWLKIPPKQGVSKEVFLIPQPQTFFSVAWRDPELGEKILANASLSKRLKSIAQWTATLDWLFVLNNIGINGHLKGASAQFYLCGNNKSQWGGRVEKELVSFFPLTRKDVELEITKYI